ncbi:hypothetical protein CH370_20960 [Leptospira kmetyi]|uniref:Transposase n=1 Tax=Leptospira kmetyi TaxID=408139 RepID=A0ABX4N643_9LEPT|nr:hypothetical protein CH378_16355 [Leptospira kmetyi]PJZ39525.1 hypothetical protein CH370_20960 [Leptospira kmetyi]
MNLKRIEQGFNRHWKRLRDRKVNARRELLKCATFQKLHKIILRKMFTFDEIISNTKYSMLEKL